VRHHSQDEDNSRIEVDRRNESELVATDVENVNRVATCDGANIRGGFTNDTRGDKLSSIEP
jgi:hypothetical protein